MLPVPYPPFITDVLGIYDEVLGNLWSDSARGSRDITFDVYKDENDLVIEASLPGFSRDNLEVTHRPGIIIIEGSLVSNRKSGVKFLIRESCSLSDTLFRREFRVPKQGEVSASMKDGVLAVKLRGAYEGSLPEQATKITIL